MYTKANQLLNDMPYYVDRDRKYAIWFNGQRDWMMGLLSNVEEGQFTFGFSRNDEFVECPTDTKDWREVIDSKWISNVNATLSCDNDTN